MIGRVSAMLHHVAAASLLLLATPGFGNLSPQPLPSPDTPLPPFVPSPVDPYQPLPAVLPHHGVGESANLPPHLGVGEGATGPPTNALTPFLQLANATGGISITELPEHNATLSHEEFNSILTRFSLDALQATQIAERLGISGSGVAALEQHLMLGGNLEGPGGAGDRPHALPLDRNPRTTPQRRRDGNGLSRATKRLFLGDQSLCYSGSCEFFLFCWLGGGLIDGGCGGFLFACCSRPNNRGQRGHESYRDDKTGFVPIDYGPIRNDRDCGLSASSRLSAQRRIVGGTEAGFGSFPWTAYIRIGSSRCGGSLINQYHVVTAGHCVARSIRVTLGDYILNSDKEHFNPRIYGASEIKVHPNFKFTPQADRFDVAVITLDAPVAYEPHIQPICLPEKGTDWLGSIAWAAGSKLRPKTLQVVDVPILDSRLCEDWHRQRGINVIIHDEMMCAGYNQGGKDSCQGDSGGPLMIQDGGRWYLAGIVSAGYSCAQSKQPGIYHKVSYTSDWISYAARS
ncbi:Serine proteinase stubble [Penaeus vannamei]|uniref:Serine proteinase stubble n=1 Tax=Penaeus vannamei TaxID=6689 RepID=A0A3R7SST5_PENVA|nr:Serine proteinase stubble [Penaeus vannamei]